MAKTHSFDVALAEKYGPLESVILSNLCFWIEKNTANQKNYYKGRYWVYNSAAAFEKIFSYFNKDQIRRLLDKLNKQGALYIDSFNKTGYDRTLWYSVSDEVMGIYNAGKKHEPAGAGTPNAAANLPDPHITADETGCPNGQMDVANSQDAFAQTGSNARMGKWGENNGKTAGMTGNEAAHTTADETGCPNGQMDAANSQDAFAQTGSNAQTGICISQNRQIDPAVPQDRSGDSAAPIPDINLYKPSSSDSPEAEKETYTGLFKKMFLAIDRRFVFSKDFYETARAVLNKYGFGEDYCRWLYRECLNIEPDNIRGLYYTLFHKPEMLELYVSSSVKNNADARKPDILCPVCGSVFKNTLPNCPSCQMRASDMCNKQDVERHKRYLALSSEQKNNYDNEMFAVLRLLGEAPMEEYQAKAREIDERYGLAVEACEGK
jgi:hypothetical protein